MSKVLASTPDGGSLYASINALLAPVRARLVTPLGVGGGLHMLSLPITGGAVSGRTLTPDALAALRPLLRTEPSVPGSTALGSLYADLCASLEDVADVDRPVYGPDDDISVLALVIGGSNIADALQRVIRIGAWLDRISPHVGLDANVTPAPRNFRVDRCYSRPSDAIELSHPDNGSGFHLVWDYPSTTDLSGVLSGHTMSISAVNVHVKGSDFTDTDDISRYAVHRMVVNGPDRDLYLLGVDATKDIWWCLSFDVVITSNESGEPDTIRYAKRSNVVRTSETRRAPRRLSEAVPPNWISVRASAQYLPGAELSDQLDALILSLTGFTDLGIAASYAAGVDAWLARLRSGLAEVLAILDAIDGIGSSISTGAYAYAFGGTGGTDLLYQELWSAMFDPSTSNRPPFDSTGSAAAMLVFVGGSDSAAEIDAVIALLELLGVDVTFLNRDATYAPDVPASNRPTGTSSATADTTEDSALASLRNFTMAANDRSDAILRGLGSLLTDSAGENPDEYTSAAGTASGVPSGLFGSGSSNPDAGAFENPEDRLAALLAKQVRDICEDK